MRAISSRPVRAVGTVLVALVPFIQLAAVSAAPDSQSDVRRAEMRLDVALDDFLSLRDRLDRARAELAAIRFRTRGLQDQIMRIAGRVVEAEEAVIEVTRALYVSGSAGLVEGLLASRSIADLEAGLTYARSSGRAHSAELERLIVNRKLLEARLDELDAERARAAELAADTKRLVDAAGGAVARRRAEVAAVREIREQARAVTQPPPAPTDSYSVDWDAIAECESGGNWQLKGRYHGGLQFHPETWLAYGGGNYARYAYQASRLQQIAVAEKLLADQGPSAWPNCFQRAT